MKQAKIWMGVVMSLVLVLPTVFAQTLSDLFSNGFSLATAFLEDAQGSAGMIAVDFFFFFFVFFIIYLKGVEYALGEKQEGKRVATKQGKILAFLLALATALLLIAREFSILDLLPYIHWLLYFLLFVFVFHLLEKLGITSFFWRLFWALLLLLLLILLINSFFAEDGFSFPGLPGLPGFPSGSGGDGPDFPDFPDVFDEEFIVDDTGVVIVTTPDGTVNVNCKSCAGAEECNKEVCQSLVRNKKNVCKYDEVIEECVPYTKRTVKEQCQSLSAAECNAVGECKLQNNACVPINEPAPDDTTKSDDTTTKDQLISSTCEPCRAELCTKKRCEDLQACELQGNTCVAKTAPDSPSTSEPPTAKPSGGNAASGDDGGFPWSTILLLVLVAGILLLGWRRWGRNWYKMKKSPLAANVEQVIDRIDEITNKIGRYRTQIDHAIRHKNELDAESEKHLMRAQHCVERDVSYLLESDDVDDLSTLEKTEPIKEAVIRTHLARLHEVQNDLLSRLPRWQDIAKKERGLDIGGNIARLEGTINSRINMGEAANWDSVVSTASDHSGVMRQILYYLYWSRQVLNWKDELKGDKAALLKNNAFEKYSQDSEEWININKQELSLLLGIKRNLHEQDSLLDALRSSLITASESGMGGDREPEESLLDKIPLVSSVRRKITGGGPSGGGYEAPVNSLTAHVNFDRSKVNDATPISTVYVDPFQRHIEQYREWFDRENPEDSFKPHFDNQEFNQWRK